MISEKYQYFGDFVDDKMEGRGVLFDNNGFVYVGGFKQSKQNGEGFNLILA